MGGYCFWGLQEPSRTTVLKIVGRTFYWLQNCWQWAIVGWNVVDGRWLVGAMLFSGRRLVGTFVVDNGWLENCMFLPPFNNCTHASGKNDLNAELIFFCSSKRVIKPLKSCTRVSGTKLLGFRVVSLLQYARSLLRVRARLCMIHRRHGPGCGGSIGVTRSWTQI